VSVGVRPASLAGGDFSAWIDFSVAFCLVSRQNHAENLKRAVRERSAERFLFATAAEVP